MILLSLLRLLILFENLKIFNPSELGWWEQCNAENGLTAGVASTFALSTVMDCTGVADEVRLPNRDGFDCCLSDEVATLGLVAKVNMWQKYKCQYMYMGMIQNHGSLISETCSKNEIQSNGFLERWQLKACISRKSGKNAMNLAVHYNR